MTTLTVRQIVEKYLKDNGYDGLCIPGETEEDSCGCRFPDLEPCGCMMPECRAGYAATVTEDGQ